MKNTAREFLARMKRPMDKFELLKYKARYDICHYLLSKSYIILNIPVPEPERMKVAAEHIARNLPCSTEYLAAVFSAAIQKKGDRELRTPLSFNDLSNEAVNGYSVPLAMRGVKSRFLPNAEMPELWRIPSVEALYGCAIDNGYIAIEQDVGGSLRMSYRKKEALIAGTAEEA